MIKHPLNDKIRLYSAEKQKILDNFIGQLVKFGLFPVSSAPSKVLYISCDSLHQMIEWTLMRLVNSAINEDTCP